MATVAQCFPGSRSGFRECIIIISGAFVGFLAAFAPYFTMGKLSPGIPFVVLSLVLLAITAIIYAPRDWMLVYFSYLKRGTKDNTELENRGNGQPHGTNLTPEDTQEIGILPASRIEPRYAR